MIKKKSYQSHTPHLRSSQNGQRALSRESAQGSNYYILGGLSGNGDTIQNFVVPGPAKFLEKGIQRYLIPPSMKHLKTLVLALEIHQDWMFATMLEVPLGMIGRFLLWVNPRRINRHGELRQVFSVWEDLKPVQLLFSKTSTNEGLHYPFIQKVSRHLPDMFQLTKRRLTSF